MSTLDFVKPVITNWSVVNKAYAAKPLPKEVSKSSELPSIMDDLAAFKESQNIIPRSEVIPTPANQFNDEPKIMGSGVFNMDNFVARQGGYSSAPRATKKPVGLVPATKRVYKKRAAK